MLGNLLDFLWEFISRRDFIGAYLFIVGLIYAWSGARRLIRQEVRDFAGDATATVAAYATLALSLGTALLGALLWQAT